MLRERKHNLSFKINEGKNFPKNAIISSKYLSRERLNDFYYRRIGYTKEDILDALEQCNIKILRAASERAASISSGIYSRLLWYMALLPTYDCIIDPFIKSNKSMVEFKEEISITMKKVLIFTEKMKIRSLASDLAYDVLVHGVSYKLKRDTVETVTLQHLPINYCRTRYKIDGKDVVEFNVRFFDDIYDSKERELILQSLPSIFKKEYNRYKNNKIPLDMSDRGAWFALPTNMAEVFYLTDDFIPFFAKVLPDILDWEAIKDINLLKSEQELSKILVQHFGTDKNGKFILEQPEITALHENALNMVGDIEGLDVLTTFADTQILDLQQKSGFNQTNDPLKNFLNSVYTNAGVSANLFATEGNLALDKSILNDESIMFMLFIEKVQSFIQNEINNRFSTSEIGFICNFPRITIYNFKDMADLFKNQAMYGFSKRLPAIATGQSQLSLMSSIEFENEVLNMSEIMIPLQSSTTQSGKNTTSKDDNSNGAGRPSLPDDQKSEKTIKNIESSN